MVCSFTAAGILNMCPQALRYASSRTSIIANYFGGLESRVLRRSWAERAAVPVVSKYCQALIELLTSVKRSLRLCPNNSLPYCIKVDSATPLPFPPSDIHSETDEISLECRSWECSEGWVLSNTHWEVWTGSVEIMEVEWKTPPQSSVRTLLDGGDGPPFLRENCTVMRGTDWDSDDDDGKALYEQDKLEKDQQKRAAEQEREEMNAADSNAAETEFVDPASEENPAGPEDDGHLASTPNAKKEAPQPEDDGAIKDEKSRKEKKKAVSSKLPLGTVLSIGVYCSSPLFLLSLTSSNELN
jgi:hypothetical protein